MKKLLWSGVVLAASCSPPPAPAQSAPAATAPSTAPVTSGAKVTMTTEEARQIAVQAVVYGLPLVIMDVTMRTATNVVSHHGMAAPVNQLAHVPRFPDATFKQVVRANVDTRYSSAFLDLSKEPLVLSVPDTHGRYHLLPLFDAWTDVFASPGTRTTGDGPGSFLVAGPDWTGTPPAGMQVLRAPTNMVWLLGRTQTNGPDDYAAVHAIQEGYRLVPLSAFGAPYTPPAGAVDASIDVKTPPVEQVKAMGAAQYLDRLARLLKSNPPRPADAPLLARLATIGVVPGQPFDPSRLDPSVAAGLEGAVGAALDGLHAAMKNTPKPANGWSAMGPNLANFGTDYGSRAIVALIAFGANLPADAIYPTAFVDGDGRLLDGANRYILHFDKGRTPPVHAFWSVTAYDADSFFVDNPIHRYAISSWMHLKTGADGSVDLIVQHQSPGKENEVNWLPVPEGHFNLTLRMYWPKDTPPSILDGTWTPPAVKRVTP
jgi:hypothetical protein